MINLLPLEQKARIKQEKRLKIVFVLAVFLAVFSVFLFLSLYLVKEMAVGGIKEESQALSEERRKFEGVLEMEENIEEFNEMVSQIDSLYKKSLDVTQTLEEIYLSLPLGVYIEKMEMEREGETEKVLLLGYSPDWKALTLLEEKLKESFSEVRFSSHSWAQVEDINFSVEIKIQ